MVSKPEVVESLKKVMDPEIMINIIDLGLVYDIRIQENEIEVDFTLTYPGCPLGPEIEARIHRQLKTDLGIGAVEANIVWRPPWDESRMSEEARFSLGYPV